MESQQPSTWPPSTGVSTPTVPRSHTILSAFSSTTINAPAPFIFNLLLDTTNYAKWSNFIPKATITSHDDTPAQPTSEPPSPVLALHTKFVFNAYMGPGAPTPTSKTYPTHLIVTDVSTPAAPSTYVPAATLAADPAYTADLQTVYRVAWAIDKSGLVSYVLPVGERFHEVIARGDGACEVRTWECQGGVVTYVVRWMFGAVLQRKFEEWVVQLKAFGEKRWEEEKGKAGAV